ncbi:MAG: SDR family oxidoreductase [Bacteroidota bacterium]
MKKLLITGSSGFLGGFCSHYPVEDWQIVQSSREKNSKNSVGYQHYPLELTIKDDVWQCLKTVKPDAVFHLAANSSTGFCEKNPEDSRVLNVDSTAVLAEMCAEKKVKFLFASSEQVFDGTKGNYREEDNPDPKNEYGRQKLNAEKAIQEIDNRAIILRLAVLYGSNQYGRDCFFSQWLDAWSKSVAVTAFHDEIRQFLSVQSCAACFYHLLKQDAEGIFHLGGSLAMSRYDFAKMMKEVLCIENAKIIEASQKDVDMPAFRPADLSLSCDKIKSTGFSLTNPLDELKALKPNLNIKPAIFLN